MERKEISKAVLKRLPGYLSYLKNIPDDASPYISATNLAAALGMGEVQVRKDLALVSDGGRPKIGYLRESLIEDIRSTLSFKASLQRKSLSNVFLLFNTSSVQFSRSDVSNSL